jgi:hypothetical protein
MFEKLSDRSKEFNKHNSNVHENPFSISLFDPHRENCVKKIEE